MRELYPDTEWDLHAHLMAGVLDVLRWANYQRAGGKGQKPKPLGRPGVRDGTTTYGKTDLPPDEAKAILAAYAAGTYDTEVSDGD